MSWNADDYVDVAERIREFNAKYPEGTLQSLIQPEIVQVGDKTFVLYGAAAYRTPDDQRPGIGWAWEPVPGPTNFTRDSEVQNAETSAWGRAIVALGFETKKIASANEVRNRQSNGDAEFDLEALVKKANKPSELPVSFGKNRGVLLGSLTQSQLRWYATEWQLQDTPSEYDHLLKTAAVALYAGDDSPIEADPLADVPFA